MGMPRWAVVLIIILIVWMIANPTGLAKLVGKAATSIGIFLEQVLS